MSAAERHQGAVKPFHCVQTRKVQHALCVEEMESEEGKDSKKGHMQSFFFFLNLGLHPVLLLSKAFQPFAQSKKMYLVF